jgi:hypothetical protein
MLEFIRSEGADVEGVFRIPPAATALADLKAVYDREGTADLEMMGDVYAAASCFKQLLRELPDPVLPDDMVERLHQAVDGTDAGNDEVADDSFWIANFRAELRHLSVTVRVTLSQLAEVCQHLCEGSATTQWRPAEIAKIVSVNLVRPKFVDVAAGERSSMEQAATVFARMITHYDEVFGPPPKGAGASPFPATSPSKTPKKHLGTTTAPAIASVNVKENVKVRSKRSTELGGGECDGDGDGGGQTTPPTKPLRCGQTRRESSSSSAVAHSADSGDGRGCGVSKIPVLSKRSDESEASSGFSSPAIRVHSAIRSGRNTDYDALEFPDTSRVRHVTS